MVPSTIGKRLQASAMLASVALVTTLVGCSNGTEAGTLDPQSSTGARLDVGDLRIRNAVMVAGDNGGLTVSMTVVNVGVTEDAITDLRVASDSDQVQGDLSPRSITLAPGTATVVPGEARPSIEIELDLPAGGFAPVTIQFESAGLVALSLPVINNLSPHSGGRGDSGSNDDEAT